MRRYQTHFVLFVVFPLWVTACRASPIPALDLRAMANDASVVVLANVSSVHKAGTLSVNVHGRSYDATEFRAVLKVHKVLKGEASPELRIRYFLPTIPVGWEGIQEHDTALFFFSRRGEDLLFTDPYHPMIPASESAECGRGETYEGILGCIRGAALDRTAPLQRRLDALWTLSKIDQQASAGSSHELLADENKQIRYAAAALLISKGDSRALATICSELYEVRQPSGPALGLLLHSLSQSTLPPDAVPHLSSLLLNGTAEVRSAAALALRNVNSSSAIEVLIRTLDYPNSDVQFNVMLALAHITKQYNLGVLREDFLANPTLYINAWKKWAVTQGYVETKESRKPE